MKKTAMYIAAAAALTAIIAIAVVGCNNGAGGDNAGLNNFIDSFVGGGGSDTPSVDPPGGGTPETFYTLNVSASPTAGGRISINPDQTSYRPNAEVTATAQPNAGYEFLGWSGASTSTGETITVIMIKDISLTANFQKIDDGEDTYYALTVAAVPETCGSVNLDPKKESYGVGEHVTATAEPEDGCKFTGWLGASESTDQTVTIIMNADKALIAAFEKISGGGDPVATTYQLTVVASPANGGKVTRNPEIDAYDAGTQVTVTATAEPGFVFTGWTEASSAKTSPVTITMDGNKVLIANFEKQIDVPVSYTLTVNASPAEGGTVSRSPSSNAYKTGEPVTVTATAASGYTFSGWSGASTSTNATITVTMNGNITLVANFTSTSTFSLPFTVDDFTDGDNKNNLRFWWFGFVYNTLPSSTITNQTLSSHINGGFSDTLSNLTAPGRGGSGYCIGLKYTGVENKIVTGSNGKDSIIYNGIGLGTALTKDVGTGFGSDFSKITSITFWARGTPIIQFSFRLHRKDNSDGLSPYMTFIDGSDLKIDEWRQYTVKIQPIGPFYNTYEPYKHCSSYGTTGNKVGDLTLPEYWGRCEDYKAEDVTRMSWELEAQHMHTGTGEFYIDDIIFNK
ncbi:hypothetical protein R80B4_02961 [Fibrobacteres bacterium R8-0-B4]